MGLIRQACFFDIQLLHLVFTRSYTCEIRVLYGMISTQLAGCGTSWLLLLVGLSKAKELVPIGERAMALRGAIRSLNPPWKPRSCKASNWSAR
jgi:hypothetical protein